MLRFAAKFLLPPKALLSDALSPQTQLPGFAPARRWTVPVYSPLWPAKPLEIIYATVDGTEPVLWNGAVEDAWLVVYRSEPGSGAGSSQSPRGKLWVRRDGTVLKQQVVFIRRHHHVRPSARRRSRGTGGNGWSAVVEPGEATDECQTMIEFDNVTRTYARKVAVDGLTLTVPPGELFALLGPNGAGKTTAIKMLTGLLRPTAGTVRVCGHDLVSDVRRATRAIGYVPEEPFLYDKLSGREFLEFAAEMRGLDRPTVDARHRSASAGTSSWTISSTTSPRPTRTA